MEGRLTEKINLARAEGDQRDGFLEELKDRVNKSIIASNDAAAKATNTRQVLSDKIGELMTRYQYLHACNDESNANLEHIKEYLRKAENRILELEQWDVDAHDKLCEIGNMLKAQQNWNEKIGTFMADLGASVYDIKKGQKKCTKSSKN